MIWSLHDCSNSSLYWLQKRFLQKFCTARTCLCFVASFCLVENLGCSFSLPVLIILTSFIAMIINNYLPFSKIHDYRFVISKLGICAWIGTLVAIFLLIQKEKKEKKKNLGSHILSTGLSLQSDFKDQSVLLAWIYRNFRTSMSIDRWTGN